MHAIVLIKQVPDTAEMRINPETGTLVRQGVPSIINPHDVHALEAALQLKDRFGGEVTVLTMGPNFFEESMKKAVGLGADRTIIVSDRAMAGADTFATSYVLAAAVRKIAAEFGPYDVIFSGRQTIDGDTGQVGPGVAARLDLSLLTYVMSIREFNLNDRYVIAERKLEGARQVVRAALPVLMTTEKELNEPRYAALPDLLKARGHASIIWNHDDLGLDASRIGLRGSPTIVSKSYTTPPRERLGLRIEGMDDPAAAAKELADRLLLNESFRYLFVNHLAGATDGQPKGKVKLP